MRVVVPLLILLAVAFAAPAFAQIDSVDYDQWVRETHTHALQGFSLTSFQVRDRSGKQDTTRRKTHRYTLRLAGRNVLLSGSHAIAGDDDSISVEFDSNGHRTYDVAYRNGRVHRIERGRYDEQGRLIKAWFDFDRDMWHAPRRYIYDSLGLKICEAYGPTDLLAAKHVILRKATDLLELDTNYVEGRSVLWARQMTTFDPLGRVKNYRYLPEHQGALHDPMGASYVFADSVGRCYCKEFDFDGSDWSATPIREISYDSTRREETKTYRDHDDRVWMSRTTYTPDDRTLHSLLTLDGQPQQEITCTYTSRGLLWTREAKDLKTGLTDVMLFSYKYSVMGP